MSLTRLHSKLQRVPSYLNGILDANLCILTSGPGVGGTWLPGKAKVGKLESPEDLEDASLLVELQFYLEQMCARKWNLVYRHGFMPLPSPPSHLLMFQLPVSQN